MTTHGHITVNLASDKLVIDRTGVYGYRDGEDRPTWLLPLDKAERVFGAALHAVEVLRAFEVSGLMTSETPPPSRSAQNAGGIEPSARGGGQDLSPATSCPEWPACKCLSRCWAGKYPSTPDDDSPVGVPV